VVAHQTDDVAPGCLRLRAQRVQAEDHVQLTDPAIQDVSDLDKHI
jgi:hypothetical protein